MRKLLILFTAVLGLSLVATPVLASEDGLGFTQVIGETYATLNVGPFTGDLLVADMGTEDYSPRARLGVSIPACCGGIYTGGVASFEFEDSSMAFDNAHLFAGYEFDLDPAIIKFSFGPKLTQDTVFYNLQTYEWNLTARLLFNPFKTFGLYTCGEGDPCATGG